MRGKIWLLFAGIAGLLLASPLFAQETAGAVSGGTNWAPIAAAFGMAIASGLCALAQGKAAAAACEGVARNPGARPGIQLFLILAFIFIESLSLYTLAIIFLKVK